MQTSWQKMKCHRWDLQERPCEWVSIYKSFLRSTGSSFVPRAFTLTLPVKMSKDLSTSMDVISRATRMRGTCSPAGSDGKEKVGKGGQHTGFQHEVTYNYHFAGR